MYHPGDDRAVRIYGWGIEGRVEGQRGQQESKEIEGGLLPAGNDETDGLLRDDVSFLFYLPASGCDECEMNVECRVCPTGRRRWEKV